MAANVPESDLKDELIELLQKSLEEAKGVIESQEKIADLKARKDKLEYAAMRSTMAQKYLDLAEKHNDDIKILKSDIDSLCKFIGEAKDVGKIDGESLRIITGILSNHGVVVRNMPTPRVTAFLEETYIPDRRLEADTQRHVENYVRLFAKATGDRQLGSYGRKDITKWVGILEKLSPSYGRGKPIKNQSIQEVLQASKGKAGLNVTTIEKHITHLKGFFKFAVRQLKFATSDDIDALFDDIRLSAHVPDSRKRKIWSIKQLNELFASPLWTGTRSRFNLRTKRHEPGSQIHVDAYWWLPIVALWTGARLEEMAQLQAEDFQYDMNQLPFIKIHNEGPRRVKNENSIRNVPLHPFLVELGFLSLFDKEKGTRIFPELRKHGRPPKVGGLYSSHFTDYRKAIGIYEELRDFHSFRRTFITTMKHKGKVDTLTIAQIAGHDSEEPNLVRLKQTDDYTDYSIADLMEAICKLDYEALGLDVSIIRRTALACGPAGTVRVEDLLPSRVPCGKVLDDAETRSHQKPSRPTHEGKATIIG